MCRHFQEASTKLQEGVNSVIVHSIDHLKYMHEFLLDFKPRVGFGIERLGVVKLIAKLIQLNSDAFCKELIKLGTFNVLMVNTWQCLFNCSSFCLNLNRILWSSTNGTTFFTHKCCILSNFCLRIQVKKPTLPDLILPYQTNLFSSIM